MTPKRRHAGWLRGVILSRRRSILLDSAQRATLPCPGSVPEASDVASRQADIESDASRSALLLAKREYGWTAEQTKDAARQIIAGERAAYFRLKNGEDDPK